MAANTPEVRQRWYEKDRENQIRRVTERRARTQAWLVDLRVNAGCSDCLENHPSVLEFHHLDEASKEFSISDAVKKGWGRERILKEIDKCIVLCANCHRKRHYALRNT